MGGSLGKHSGTAQLRCRSDITRTDRAPLNKLLDIARQKAISNINSYVELGSSLKTKIDQRSLAEIV
jgi:hypothetical protein